MAGRGCGPRTSPGSSGAASASCGGWRGKPVPASNRAEARDIWINALDPLGDRRAVEG